jgi:uncharacterized damage-inducible protein DinB
MSELRHIRDWYRYNSDVRKEYLKVLSRLPRRALLKDRKASFPSLLDIFVHTLDAYQWWFGQAYRDRAAGYKGLRETIRTLAAARRYERQVDRLVLGFIKRLDARTLAGTFSFTDTRGPSQKPQRYKMSTRGMVLHMIEEELQHRGELNALLWQIDAAPPDIGFDDWNKGRR